MLGGKKTNLERNSTKRTRRNDDETEKIQAKRVKKLKPDQQPVVGPDEERQLRSGRIFSPVKTPILAKKSTSAKPAAGILILS
jgi:hypothetical protein